MHTSSAKMIYSNRCIQSKQPHMIKTAIYNDIFTSLRDKKNQSKAKQFKELFSRCVQITFNGMESSFVRFDHVYFQFRRELTPKKQCFLQCFHC